MVLALQLNDLPLSTMLTTVVENDTYAMKCIISHRFRYMSVSSTPVAKAMALKSVWMLMAAVIVLMTRTSTAIRCYECDSLQGNSCKDPFGSSLTAKTCPSFANQCMKSKASQDGMMSLYSIYCIHVLHIDLCICSIVSLVPPKYISY